MEKTQKKIKKYLKRNYNIQETRVPDEGVWLRLKNAPKILEEIAIFIGNYGEILINLWPYIRREPKKSIQIIKEGQKIVKNLQNKFGRDPGILWQDSGSPADSSSIESWLEEAREEQRGSFTDGLIFRR